MDFQHTSAAWILTVLVLAGSCSPGSKDSQEETDKSAGTGVRVVKEYYPDGRIKSETEAVGKLRQGKSKVYRKDGTLETLISYENNRKHGPAQNFYANGKTVKTEIIYVDGYKHGEARWYYPDGQIYRTTPYVNGRINGIRRVYYENGNLQAEIPYRDSQPGMGLKEYNPDGTDRTFDAAILFDEQDRISLDNSFRLSIYLSDGSRNVEFFQGQLTGGKFWNDQLSPVPTDKGIGVIDFHVSEGSFRMETIHLVARVKSGLDHYHILQRDYHLALENKF